MPLAANTLRRSITRLMYKLMGLRISAWRNEITQLWALDPDERARHLERCLRKTRPRAADGTKVESLAELAKAPPLTKAVLRARTASLPKNARTFGRHTAGTTGEPVHIWLNKEELSRMLAVRDYCFRHHGLKLGDREARVWGRSAKGVGNRVKDLLMNRRIFHPAGPDAVGQVSALLAYKPVYIYGYSSLILEAARIIQKGKLVAPTGLKCIICTAETILPVQKQFISEQFQAPVAEEYGNTEFDVIAFECKEGHRHMVNPWLVPSASDSNGIFSDVSRTTQNLIRYETGDALGYEQCSCTKLGGPMVIRSLDGRSIDRFAYVSRDEKFHAVEFSRAMDSYLQNAHGTVDFQVAQIANNQFQLRVVSRGAIDEFALCSHIQEYIAHRTGYTIGLQAAVVPDKTHLLGSKRSYFVRTETEEKAE